MMKLLALAIATEEQAGPKQEAVAYFGLVWHLALYCGQNNVSHILRLYQ